jgi:hypothetical protein
LELGAYVHEFGEGIEALAQRLDADGWPPQLGLHCKSSEFRAGATDA